MPEGAIRYLDIYNDSYCFQGDILKLFPIQSIQNKAAVELKWEV